MVNNDETYLLLCGRELFHKPDRHSLVRREINHGLSGEESIDFAFGPILSVEIPDINDFESDFIGSFLNAFHAYEIIWKLMIISKAIKEF